MSSSSLTLVALAAGMGSRYGGVKQIDGFGPNGETILDYSLFDALRAGFTKIVFIVRPDILKEAQALFLPKLQSKVQVEFVIQSLDTDIPAEFCHSDRVKPWGTGHALLCAHQAIKDPFIVINADDFYGRTAFEEAARFFHSDHQGAHAMIGYVLRHVLSDYGSVSRGCGEVDDQGFLTRIVERMQIVRESGKIWAKEEPGAVEISPETPTSMNFWGFHPSIFDWLKQMFDAFMKAHHADPKSEFLIPSFVNKLIESQKTKVRVLSGGDTWFGVTYPEDKKEVSSKIKKLIQQGIYPERLW